MPQQTSPRAAHPDVTVETNNSSDKPPSPIALRLRHPNQDSAFNMPMVELSGPEGATLVFREDTTQKELHMAAMTMYSTVRDYRQPHHGYKQKTHSRDNKWGNNANRFPRIVPTDVCFHCGQTGHWKRDCPTSQIPENTSD